MTAGSLPTPSGPSRFGLLTLIVAAHAMMLLWLVMLAPSQSPPLKADQDIVMLDLAGRAAASPKPTPKRVSHPPAPPLPVVPLIILPAQPAVALSASDPSPAAGDIGGCAFAAQAADAIAKDPAAMAELRTLPPGARTAADAVMLWNGAWLTNPSAPEIALVTHIEERVRQVIESAPEACRDAAVTGPVFVPIQEADRVTTIVVGSGVWRWRDLVEAPPPAAITPPPFAFIIG